MFNPIVFTYIVNPPVLPKVAFGSGLQRETLPEKGPNVTAFMRRTMGEVGDYPGATKYDVSKGLGFKYPSNKGFTAFASKAPRLPPTDISPNPPVGHYDIEKPKPFKQLIKPFGVGAGRKDEEQFLTPGPSTYKIDKGFPKLHMCYSFGHTRITWPTVAVFCSQFNRTRCYKCEKKPKGDFWHNFKTKKSLCRPCKHAVEAPLKECNVDLVIRMKKRKFLDQFKPARYCSFYHTHLSSNSIYRIMTKKDLQLKITKENYFTCYWKKDW